MTTGWIKLHWSVKGSLAWSNGQTFALWGHILLCTAYKPQLMRNGRRLEVGEALMSTKDLAKWIGVSDRTVRRYLQEFVADGMLEVLKSDRNGTHVKVCNWETFQRSGSETVREVQ
ncbi:hypothetical protein Mal64_34640 [Pseudobythopirellula maris]|uniref:HTH crp-type domain-containing protein n=1 Tax=Pseudobythopirellula maris TaxID=2527991 RepID=A0A5C5ZHQ0_9BACT|nr:hypothetical protein Mal64_34640 [Pseudobythopirellula maris]